MNSFGNKFRITVFGESHGPYIGVVMDGVTPGIELSEEDFSKDLERRKKGDLTLLAEGVTARQEEDVPVFASGILNGVTTGAPLAILFENKNQNSKDYGSFRNHPRPSHADFAASFKFNSFNDLRGGGMFSGRMTTALVAAGVVAKKMLKAAGLNITFCAKISSIGGVPGANSKEEASANVEGWASANTAEEGTLCRWKEIIHAAKTEGDSVGGEITCRIEGVPAGKGAPFFDSLESQIAHLAFSVPGVKGVRFGDFSDIHSHTPTASSLKGSEFNDAIIDKEGTTATNHSGGINGGLSNGNPIVFTLDIRPTASIAKPQRTLNLETGQMEDLSIGGRHDACIALRIPVIAEAISAIVLANNRGG